VPRLLRLRRRGGTGGTDPVDLDEFEQRIVWIFGSPRTGSTWLLRLLCHPLILDNEVSVGFRVPANAPARALEAIPVNEMYLANHLAPAVDDPVRMEDGTWWPVTIGGGLADRPPYVFSHAFMHQWRPEIRRFALMRLRFLVDLAASEHSLRDPLVIVKEVSGSHAADFVMSLFPRSRFLFLIRDGRDVLDSRLHAHGPEGWAARHWDRTVGTPEERLDLVRRMSLEWLCNIDSCRRAYDTHPPELRRQVRYEELLADTAGTLEGLLGWLGSGHGARWVSRAVEVNRFDAVPDHLRGPTEPYRAATPGLWRENLGPDERRLANEIMGERLVALGYEGADGPDQGDGGRKESRDGARSPASWKPKQSAR
jgi:hypothetical protein